MAKPIVKWAGGKTRLLGELGRRVPGDVRTYAEPFAGGAALFFSLFDGASAKRLERAVLVDQNEELVACYRAVKTDVDSVIHALRSYKYDRDLFYETRALDTRGMSDVQRAARLLFLNRTCFNGLWRENSEGKFNVPFGRYTNPKILDEVALRAASTALARATILHGDFARGTAKLGEGDFAYFDPPYVPLTKTADFTSYVAGGFGPADQTRLRDELRALQARGVLAMLSNADTSETRALYAEFGVHVVQAPRRINSDPRKRGDASELIVTTWGPYGLFRSGVALTSSRPPQAGRKTRAKRLAASPRLPRESA